MSDKEYFVNIKDRIYFLARAVEEAKKAGLHVHLLSDNHGLTITARVSREYCMPEEKVKK